MGRAKRVHRKASEPGAKRTAKATSSTGPSLDAIANKIKDGDGFSQADVMTMQRTIGNQATIQMLRQKQGIIQRGDDAPEIILGRQDTDYGDSPSDAIVLNDDNQPEEAAAQPGPAAKAPDAPDDEETTKAKKEIHKTWNRINRFEHVNRLDGPYEAWMLRQLIFKYKDTPVASSDEYHILRNTIKGAFPWILSKEISDKADMMAEYNNQKEAYETKVKQDEADDQASALAKAQKNLHADDDKTNKKKMTGGQALSQAGKGAKELVSMGFSVEQGAKSVKMIKEGAKGLKAEDIAEMSPDIMNEALSFIAGKAFGAVAIGYDLIRAFQFHRRRRNGYFEAMKRSGIDKKGRSSVAEDSKENIEKIKLGKAAFYAFKKTSRAFYKSLLNAALKVIKWVAHVITLFSGGIAAIVSEAVALSADLTRAASMAWTKAKGIYKGLRGTKGANREVNAKEILRQAINGDDSALETIMDVYPFDEFKNTKKAKGAIANAAAKTLTLGKKGVELPDLPAPTDKKDLHEQLTNGYYANKKMRKALQIALAETMKSQ